MKLNSYIREIADYHNKSHFVVINSPNVKSILVDAKLLRERDIAQYFRADDNAENEVIVTLNNEDEAEGVLYALSKHFPLALIVYYNNLI